MTVESDDNRPDGWVAVPFGLRAGLVKREILRYA